MESSVLLFTKIKSWYLPVDIETYKTLRDLGVPLTKIHENFLPTLKLLTEPRGIKAKLVDFNEKILDPYLDQIGNLWQRKAGRKASISSSQIKLEATGNHAEAFEKVEASLRRFFTRWGFQAVIEFSEARGKSRLHVTYKFDNQRIPIVPLAEEPHAKAKAVINLGFLRITMLMGQRDVETTISLAAGTEWKSIHTSKALYSQVSDVRPMIKTLMDVVNHEPHNFEINPNKEHV